MKFLAYTISVCVVMTFLVLGLLITRYAFIHENNLYLASLLFSDIIHPKEAEAILAKANIGELVSSIEKPIVLALDFCLPNFNTKSLRVRVSVVDFLNINDFDSSFIERAELAKIFEIPDYHGTAKENLKMLEFLKTQSKACSLAS